MWLWWTSQYGCYCHTLICRVSNSCLFLYLHFPGDYDRVLESTFGVLKSSGINFGQDSGNSVNYMAAGVLPNCQMQFLCSIFLIVSVQFQFSVASLHHHSASTIAFNSFNSTQHISVFQSDSTYIIPQDQNSPVLFKQKYLQECFPYFPSTLWGSEDNMFL